MGTQEQNAPIATDDTLDVGLPTETTEAVNDAPWLDEPSVDDQPANDQPVESEPPADEPPVEQDQPAAEPSELEKLKAQNAELVALLTKFTQQPQQAQQPQPAPAALARTKALVSQRFNDASGQNLADVLESFRAEIREELDRQYAPLEGLRRTEGMVMNVALGEEERRVYSMLGSEGVKEPVLAKARDMVSGWIKQGKMFPDAETAYRAAVQKLEAASRRELAGRNAAAQQDKQKRQQTAGFPANTGTRNKQSYGDLVSRAKSLSTDQLLEELKRLG